VDELEGRYFFSITFTGYEAYTYWKGVEEEDPDYGSVMAEA
jgi:hypothetical protein